MSAVLEYPQRHPISLEEYLRMGEAGIFAPEARLELNESVSARALAEAMVAVSELFPK